MMNFRLVSENHRYICTKDKWNGEEQANKDKKPFHIQYKTWGKFSQCIGANVLKCGHSMKEY